MRHNGFRHASALFAFLSGTLAFAAPPKVTHPDAPLVALYDEAWREASERTLDAPEGAPVKRYMDECVYSDYIWVWDSCFMAQFTKYAASDYPGIESVDALYAALVEGKKSPLKVWHPDNPPLFAWCELVHWRFHGDRARLEDVVLKRRLLQRHYEWFKNPPTGKRPTSCGVTVYLKPATASNGAKGWIWGGTPSGMDNTPRGRGCGGYGGILWVDAIAQQALSAKCIAELLEDLGKPEEAKRWRAEYDALARTDADYNAKTGDYWRGGIWLPTAYMTVKAMERYGARDLADIMARRLVEQMERTYRAVEPHTIWECYAPEADTPSTEGGRRARPVFCGWSALGPINLFLENILGLREFRAADRTIRWEPPANAAFPMGIEGLTFGDTTVSLWTDNVTLRVTADKPVTLFYQGRRFAIDKGSHTLTL